MECRYQIIEEDCITSFNPQYRAICTRCGSPPFPECDEDSCTYFQEKLEEELRKNPTPSPGFRRCPYTSPDSGFQCSIYLNNCFTCGLNPAVKEQREKERAERKMLEEESKLSYKLKRFFKKEGWVMKKSIKWKENIYWPAFITCVILLYLSLVFKAWDMAAVSIFGIFGVVVLFIYNCWMDWKIAREIDAYKAHLAEEGRQRVGRDLKSLDSLDQES